MPQVVTAFLHAFVYSAVTFSAGWGKGLSPQPRIMHLHPGHPKQPGGEITEKWAEVMLYTKAPNLICLRPVTVARCTQFQTRNVHVYAQISKTIASREGNVLECWGRKKRRRRRNFARPPTLKTNIKLLRTISATIRQGKTENVFRRFWIQYGPAQKSRCHLPLAVSRRSRLQTSCKLASHSIHKPGW